MGLGKTRVTSLVRQFSQIRSAYQCAERQQQIGQVVYQQQQQRSVSYMPRPGDGTARAVTLIPGDGIGPLVTGAVVQVMKAMHAPIFFETYEVSGRMNTVPQEVFDSIRRNGVCLKGGLATPVGGGVSSLNVQLRKELDLFASLVHCFNLPGLKTRHDNVDIVVIRENTEGEYSGLEHEVVPGVVESLKVRTGLMHWMSQQILKIRQGRGIDNYFGCTKSASIGSRFLVVGSYCDAV
jgi:isocitrate dehydrogenase